MKLFTLLFLFLVGSLTLCAQMTARIDCNSSDNCDDVCPGEVEEYIIYTNYAGYIITCDEWEVTGGTIISGGEENDYKCKVSWNDVEEGRILIPKISASTTADGVIANVYNVLLEIAIHSLNGVQATSIGGDFTVDMSSTTPVTYTSSPIKNHAGEDVSEYSWNIPAGWSVGGVVSTGSEVYTTSSQSITVTPDNCSAGDIKVWAENNKCGTQFIASTKKSKPITRTFPSLTIDGPSVLCGSESYQVNNVPSGFSITWNSSYNITRTGPQGSNPCTFSSSSSDEGYIKASLSSNVCNSSVDLPDKLVRLNGPAFDDIYLDLLTSGGQDASIMCENTTYHIYLMNDGPCSTSSYTWSLPSGWTKFYTWNNMVSVNTNSSPGGMVEVNANTCCGTNKKIITDYMPGGYCGGYYMAMSPNPANTYVELSFTELIEEPMTTLAKSSNETISSNEEIIKKNEFGELGNYTIEILDKNGTIWKSVQSSNLNERIEIRDLRPGIYFVHIITDKEVYKRQLLVK